VPAGTRWKAGDVVGLACDLEAMQVLVSVNGSFDAPSGLVFELDAGATRGGLLPAFPGTRGTVRCNLGGRPFLHPPPSPAFVNLDSVDVDKDDVSGAAPAEIAVQAAAAAQAEA
jgi:hypothetical protein